MPFSSRCAAIDLQFNQFTEYKKGINFCGSTVLLPVTIEVVVSFTMFRNNNTFVAIQWKQTDKGEDSNYTSIKNVYII